MCDDAQWLDEESLAVLAIVARRLQADGITLLLAIRDGEAGGRLLDDLPQAVLPELTRSDSHALLTRRLSAQIEQGVAERIVTEAAGNPLAIRELASDLESPAGADPVPLSERLPLGRAAPGPLPPSVPGPAASHPNTAAGHSGRPDR